MDDNRMGDRVGKAGNEATQTAAEAGSTLPTAPAAKTLR